MKKQILPLMFAVFLSLAFISLASVQALIIESVSTTPSEIAPGETSIIRLGLENNAEEDIEDVSVSLIFREAIKDSFSNVVTVNEVPFAPYDSASEFNIDEIKDGKTKYAEFKIKALNDAKSGIYKIPLQITYEEGGVIKTKSSLISITVNSKPIIGVSIEDGLLLKGNENKAVVKIVNKGLSDVKFLEVEIKKGAYYTILSQANVYIGDIDSNDFDSADFNLFFKENSPSTINLPVSVTYKDSLNKGYTEDFTLPLRVYTKEQAIQLGLLKKSNTTTYIIVVVVLIIIYIIYRKIKKWRKMKKKMKEG